MEANRRSLSLGRKLRGRAAAGLRTSLGWPAIRRCPLAPLEHWHRIRRTRRPERYTRADAFAIRFVDPDAIEGSVLESTSRRPQWGRLESGNWEGDAVPFGERAVPRAITQRFEAGLPWVETPLREAFIGQLERFGLAWGYTELDDFEERCRDVERLYASISSNGYRLQEELAARPYRTTLRLDEVNVDIGRDGTLYWRCCGQHRLAIAQSLDLERIPVLVHRRHTEWESTRERIRHSTLSDPALETHPDIRPVVAGGE